MKYLFLIILTFVSVLVSGALSCNEDENIKTDNNTPNEKYL
jgi:hypothetical protein